MVAFCLLDRFGLVASEISDFSFLGFGLALLPKRIAFLASSRPTDQFVENVSTKRTIKHLRYFATPVAYLSRSWFTEARLSVSQKKGVPSMTARTTTLRNPVTINLNHLAIGDTYQVTTETGRTAIGEYLGIEVAYGDWMMILRNRDGSETIQLDQLAEVQDIAA